MINNDLRKTLEGYKEYTLRLIASLEKEDLDSLEELLSKRQEYIESMNKMQYTKDEFSAVVKELQILVYQKKLDDMMVEKRSEVKQELGKILQAKNANSSYNKNLYSGSKVFNKRI